MKKVIVIGAGAAGYFAAIHCAQVAADAGRELDLRILEASGKTLAKVRISGGGRCNLTHGCFDPRDLVQNYPRGEKELRGPFHHFGPHEVMQWFEQRGVDLKIEDDGRVFPQSDDSQSIVSALQQAADAAGVVVEMHQAVRAIVVKGKGFELRTANSTFVADAIIMASGSSRSLYATIRTLGHQIVEPQPSLFTFKCGSKAFHVLSGLSVNPVSLEVHVGTEVISSKGPLLLTHWGFSGPAVLKASAWAARLMAAVDYRCDVYINWLPQQSLTDIIDEKKRSHGGQRIVKMKIEGIPQRLLLCLLRRAGVSEDLTWAQLPQDIQRVFYETIHHCRFAINGKTIFKEEFVTAGGIFREEINWQRMESKICPGLYFAGECIDVDAVTGGFNFQNAWTTAWIAAQACSASCGESSAV